MSFLTTSKYVLEHLMTTNLNKLPKRSSVCILIFKINLVKRHI